MKLSEQGYKLVKQSEGFRANRYKDAAGFLTVGYGHKLTPVELAEDDFANGITEAEGVILLKGDVAEAEAAVERLVKVPLTQGQFDALVDFVYNLGAGKLGISTLRKVLNQGRYDDACKELERWNHAGTVVLEGLTARRKAEQALWNS